MSAVRAPSAERSLPGCLLVIVPDEISELLRKGEVIERYYNPGELFEDVHLVLTNDDAPAPAAVRRMAGAARVQVHNIPVDSRLFLRSLGWRPWLLKGWCRAAVDLAERLRPTLVRCHGAYLNALAARQIKRELGVPYVVSLHINPDEDVRGRAQGCRSWLSTHLLQSIERLALREADCVLPVYRPILPYLRRMGVTKVEVAYNVLTSRLQRKVDYELHRPVRVVSVGRQLREKNPEQLIRAIAELPGVELTLIGDGPFHGHLRGVAAACGLDRRVTFLPAVPNDELCARLPDFDIFATHTEYWELSKSVIEALLTGLPVVLNRRRGEPVPELTDDICLFAENSVAGYRDALRQLIENRHERESLGRRAREHAELQWSPAVTEARYVDIYRRVVAGRTAS